MALKLWAPLNGDLRQIGASNAVLTNDGTTVDNSGKIGKCYSFANTRIIVDSTDIQDTLSSTTQPFSMACWIYLNSDETDRVIIFGNYNANPFVNWELAANCTQRLCAGGTSNYANRANGTIVPKTTWTHIAVTYNGATTTFYQNGVSVGSVNGANTLTTKTASSRFYLGSDTRTGATRLKGKMNDFRFYDHCLSAAEVHEIAQGLVLHYKLDDIPQNFSKNTNTNWTNVTLGQYYVTIFSYSMADFQALTGAKNGDKFTWSLDLNSTGGTKHITARVQHYNTSSDRVSVIGNPIAPNTSGRSSITFTINTAYKQLDFMITNSDSGSITANSTEQYKNTKIQAGDVSTAWVPTGLEEIVEDSSGYNHNGTINGDIIISSDTNRYNYSTQFDGVDDSITVPYNAICPENIFTLNLWFKKDALGSKSYETLFGGPSGFEMDTRSGSATALSLYMASTRSGKRNLITELSLGNWYMITMTRDGTKEKYYVNGIFQSEIDAKSMPTGNYYIGAWQTTAKQNYYGLISDFRIYCTALDADAIRQLYEVSAKIDNKANFHAYEINENGTNKLTKTGIMYDNMEESIIILPDGSHWQLLMFHYVDNGNNLFTKNNALYCNDFGLFSRLQYIDNFKYTDTTYEFYVIQDGVEYRWTQTNAPTATSPSGFSAVSGYANPVQGLVKNGGNTYFGYSSWWGACGCWTKWSTGGKSGIPGFGPHDATGTCSQYLALYARIPKADVKLSNQTANASEFIEL